MRRHAVMPAQNIYSSGTDENRPNNKNAFHPTGRKTSSHTTGQPAAALLTVHSITGVPLCATAGKRVRTNARRGYSPGVTVGTRTTASRSLPVQTCLLVLVIARVIFSCVCYRKPRASALGYRAPAVRRVFWYNSLDLVRRLYVGDCGASSAGGAKRHKFASDGHCPSPLESSRVRANRLRPGQ